MKRFLVFAIIILGSLFLVLTLVFFFKEQPTFPEESSFELDEMKNKDITSPVTAILSPADKSWHRIGFFAEIRDSDLGSGLTDFAEGEQGCRYIIQDLSTKEAMGGFRPCKETKIFVPVGENQVCSSSFEAQSSSGKCRVSVRAVDKAGNESGWESKTFYIDLESPLIQSITSLLGVIQPEEKHILSARVSDNNKIVGCSLLLDGKQTEAELSLVPLPCKEKEICTISASYTFSIPGDHAAFFACRDNAGNIAAGEPFSFRVFVNKPPVINLCRITPVSGISDTNFRFIVEAQDPDSDPLSFNWEFGDGAQSTEITPVHQYSSSGIYMPKVTVQDVSGESVFCNTAWVVVQE